MSVKPHLQTSLSQRLVLTPQMQQRIELLAMTKLELSDMVTTELSANPILEEVMPGEGGDDQSPAEDVASIDATTADYAAPDGVASEPPVEAAAPAVEIPAPDAAPLDGEAEPDRERDS